MAPPIAKSDEMFLSLKKILLKLNDFDTLEDKMRNLCMLDSLASNDIAIRVDVCYRIESYFRKFYVNPEVLMYGSSASGLGSKNCDLDLLFVPFPEYCNTNVLEPEKIVIPNLHHIKKRLIPKENLHALSEKGHLKFLLGALRYDKFTFRNPCFIPAKCPILNFTLVKSGMKCDLSCRNRLVVKNTELLRFYDSLDSRFHPLIRTLNLWAKCLGLIATNRFSSYAFNLLVVFFLQNTEPIMLPSVIALKDLEQAENYQEISGWDVTFSSNIYKIEKNQNTNEIGELLYDFFEFYWNFDFLRYVVCPRSGKPLPIEDVNMSTDERMNEFSITSVCIQDPFLLNHNVSQNVSLERLSFFKMSSFIALKKFLKHRSLRTDIDFVSFFSIKEYNMLIDKKLSSAFLDNVSTIDICMHEKIVAKLSKNFPEPKIVWYDWVTQSVLDILQYGLLFECEVVDKCLNHKCTIISPCSDNDVFENSMVLLMSIQCSVSMRTWHSRGKVATVLSDEKSMDFGDEVLNCEHNISNKVMNLYPNEHSSTPLFWFLVNCYGSKFSQLMHVTLAFVPLTESSEFNALKIFLKKFLSKTVLKMLTLK